MKEMIIIVATIILCLCLLASCAGGETIHHTDSMNEWISPDGVHYWKDYSGYMGYMAPRYDHEGNLVIENWDVQ